VVRLLDHAPLLQPARVDRDARRGWPLVAEGPGLPGRGLLDLGGADRPAGEGRLVPPDAGDVPERAGGGRIDGRAGGRADGRGEDGRGEGGLDGGAAGAGGALPQGALTLTLCPAGVLLAEQHTGSLTRACGPPAAQSERGL